MSRFFENIVTLVSTMFINVFESKAQKKYDESAECGPRRLYGVLDKYKSKEIL